MRPVLLKNLGGMVLKILAFGVGREWMKRIVIHVMSLMIVFMLLLSGCSTAQPTNTPNIVDQAATPTPAVDQKALSATETAFAGRIRPTRSQTTATPTGESAKQGTPAGGTPTAGAISAKPNPAGGSATATRTAVQPSATPTMLVPPSIISTLGAIPVPDKRQVLKFAPNGNVVSVVDYLNDGVPVAYQLNATANQLIYLAVYGRTNIQIYDPKMAPVTYNLVMPGYLRLVAADSGVYTIVMSGLGNSILSVYLPDSGGNLASAAPVPAKPQAVNLPVQPLSVSFYNKLTEPAAYTFPGQAGQTLTLLVSGNLTTALIMPDGNSADAEIDTVAKLWVFTLPETGSYTLVFLGDGVVNVTAKITPPVSGTQLAAPQAGSNIPIMFAPSSSLISFSTYLVPEKNQSYVVHLPAKQAFFVDLTGNASVTKIVGPGNTPVVVNHADITKHWSIDIAQEGDYIITISGKGPSLLKFSLPTK
jgi:hypothetical protein